MDASKGWWFGPFHLDLHGAVLLRRSESVELRPKDFALLQHFIESAGKVLSRDEILEAVWPETFVTDDVLRGGVARLRRVLDDDAKSPRYIATVPRRGYRWLAPASTEPPRVSMSSRQEPAPVGRESTLQSLERRLDEALAGRRQLVLLTGAAGLGKTTVVEAFLARSRPLAPRAALGQCVEQFGDGEAYLPVLEAVGRLCRGAEGSDTVAVLRRRAPTWLVQMPWLLEDEDRQMLRHELQGTTSERMMREIAEALEELSAHRPLILVFEDLHWSDRATFDLLARLVQRREPARLLLLGTYRPEEVGPATRPLQGLRQTVLRHAGCHEFRLSLLSAAQVATYLDARFASHELPSALAAALHRTTDGQPLFLVTLLDSLLARGVIDRRHGVWVIRDDVSAPEGPIRFDHGSFSEIPESLRQMILYQLEGCSPDEQSVLTAASVAGVEFSAPAVAAALKADEVAVEDLCESMARRGGPVGRRASEGNYVFRHALYREVAYQQIAAARRRRFHRRLAEHLEAALGGHGHGLAAELAVHWQHAREYSAAIRWRLQAARDARRCHAYREAITHLRTASDLLCEISENPERQRQELAVRMALGAALLNAEGPTGEAVLDEYQRARTLCHDLGETQALGRILYALWVARSSRVEHRLAREIGEELLALGQRAEAPPLRLIAGQVLGTTAWWLGEFPRARRHLDEASRLGAGLSGASAGPEVLVARISSDSYGALALCLLGFADQARQRMEESLREARKLMQPHTLAPTLMLAASLYLYCRDADRGRELAEELVAVSRQYGFAHWRAGGVCLAGWAQAQQGELEEGLARQRQGLEAWRQLGIGTALTSLLTQHASVLLSVGRGDEFEAVVAEARSLAAASGELPWEAELYRLEGEWRLSVAGDGGERSLEQALELARSQEAKLWELRAAISLARSRHRRGDSAAARRLLAEVHGWFSEGFDLADLRDAAALLEDLSPFESPRRRRSSSV